MQITFSWLPCKYYKKQALLKIKFPLSAHFSLFFLKNNMTPLIKACLQATHNVYFLRHTKNSVSKRWPLSTKQGCFQKVAFRLLNPHAIGAQTASNILNILNINNSLKAINAKA
jgi:hypothetical protein